MLVDTISQEVFSSRRGDFSKNMTWQSMTRQQCGVPMRDCNDGTMQTTRTPKEDVDTADEREHEGGGGHCGYDPRSQGMEEKD